MTPVVTVRPSRTTWVLGVGTVLVVALSLVVARPAGADPVGDLQARARAIAAQLDSLQHQAEVASERANGADYHLAQIKEQLGGAQDRSHHAADVVALNEAAVSEWAVRAYASQDGSTGLAELFRSNSDDVATRAGYRQAVLGDRQQLVDDLAAARVDADGAVQALQADEAAAEAAARQAKAQRTKLFHLVAQQHQLQAGVQGQLALAVAQQQAELQANAERQAAAGTAASGPSSVTSAVLPGTTVATPPGAPTSSPPPGAPTGPAPTATTGSPGSGAPTTRAPSPTDAPPPVTSTVAPKPVPTPSHPTVGPAPPVAGGAATAVAAARSQVGKPYIWGGASPTYGFDCSGLTSWAWAQAGVSIPHFAQAQYDLSRHISAAALQPGDLVFYADSTGYVYHVALYLGGGQVVQALNERYGVMIGSLYSAGRAPYGYGRV